MLDRLVADRASDANTHLPGSHTLPVGRADGCFVLDEYGQQYLDFGPGGRANALGHNNVEVFYAIQNILYNRTYTAPDHLDRSVVDYARALSARLPPDSEGNPRQVLVLPSAAGVDGLVGASDRDAYNLWEFLLDPQPLTDGTVLVFGSECGGGLPIAVVVATRRFFGAQWSFDFDQHPVISAAALCVLNQVTDGLLAHASAVSGVFRRGLGELATQFPDLDECPSVGVGLTQWITLSPTSSLSKSEVYQRCRSKGLLVHRDLSMTPPLVASEQEVKQAVDIIADVFLDWS